MDSGPLHRAAVRAEVDELLAESAWALDDRDYERYATFFTDDATYEVGGELLRGRAAIVRRFTARQGERTIRHLYSGLRVSPVGDGAWKARSVWLSFAAEGRPPIDEILPYQVADFEDEVVQRDGRWLIRSRQISSVFRDPRLAPRS